MDNSDTGGDGETIGIEKEKKTEVVADSVSGRGQDNEGFEEEEEEEEVEVGMSEEKKEESKSVDERKEKKKKEDEVPLLDEPSTSKNTEASEEPAAAAAPEADAARAAPPADAAHAAPPTDAAAAAPPADAAPAAIAGRTRKKQMNFDWLRKNVRKYRSPSPPPLPCLHFPMDRMIYAPWYFNIFMIICTLFTQFAIIALLNTDFFVPSPSSPPFCSSSLIPNVSSDGQMDKNIWKDEGIFLTPCRRAWPSNNAIRKQLAEGTNELTGEPRHVIEKMQLYQRAVARVSNISISVLDDLMSDEVKKAISCKSLLNVAYYPSGYHRGICRDGKNDHLDGHTAINYRINMKEDERRDAVGENLFGPMSKEDEEMMSALWKFQTISFFHSFMFGEYREFAIEEAFRGNEQVWVILRESILHSDHGLFIKTMQRDDIKGLHWFMEDVVMKMINRLEAAASEDPKEGEKLLDWIRSTRIGRRLDLSHFSISLDGLIPPSCTGSCLSFFPLSSHGLIHDSTLRLCKLTLYILFVLSIPQLILYLCHFKKWIDEWMRKWRPVVPPQPDQMEMNDMNRGQNRRQSANSRRNSMAPLTVPPSLFEKAKYTMILPYIYFVTFLCLLTFAWMVHDFLFALVGHSWMIGLSFSHQFVLWRVFLYIIFTPIFVDVLYFWSSAPPTRSYLNSSSEYRWKLANSVTIFAIFLTTVIAARVGYIWHLQHTKINDTPTSLCDPSLIPSLSGIHAKLGMENEDLSILPCFSAQDHNDDVINRFISRMQEGVDSHDVEVYLDGLNDYNRALARVTSITTVPITQYLKEGFSACPCTQLRHFGTPTHLVDLSSRAVYIDTPCDIAHCVNDETDFGSGLHPEKKQEHDTRRHTWMTSVSLLHSFLNGEYRNIVTEICERTNEKLWKKLHQSIKDQRHFWSIVNSKEHKEEYVPFVTEVMGEILHEIHDMSVKNPQIGETWPDYFDRTMRNGIHDPHCTDICEFIRDHYGINLGNTTPYVIILSVFILLLIPLFIGWFLGRSLSNNYLLIYHTRT